MSKLDETLPGYDEWKTRLPEQPSTEEDDEGNCLNCGLALDECACFDEGEDEYDPEE